MKKTARLILIALLSLSHYSLSAKIDAPEEEIDNSVVIDRITNDDVVVIMPSFLFTFKEATIKLKFHNPNHTKLLLNKNVLDFIINGENKTLRFDNGEAEFRHQFNESNTLSVFSEEFSYSAHVTAYPLWALLVPVFFLILIIIIRLVRKRS